MATRTRTKTKSKLPTQSGYYWLYNPTYNNCSPVEVDLVEDRYFQIGAEESLRLSSINPNCQFFPMKKPTMAEISGKSRSTREDELRRMKLHELISIGNSLNIPFDYKDTDDLFNKLLMAEGY